MWLTALILGFAGSMHCLGMCTPLLMAVTSMKPAALYNRIIYNAGRLFSYGCLGAFVASAGLLLPIHKLQNFISLTLGIILLLIGAGALRSVRVPGLATAVSRATGWLKKQFALQLKKGSRLAIFLMGSINGLLPCGLTLIAITSCISLRGPLDGFNFMFLFGIGTLPVMLGFTGALPAITKKLNWSFQKLSTSMLIISGCILIARVFIVHVPHTTALNGGGIMEIMLCR